MRGNSIIQTLLSGVAGGTRGYVAQRNRRDAEGERQKDRERQDLFTMLTLMDRDGTEMARPGQDVQGAIPSAVPMAGVGADAMRTADQQAGPRSGDVGMGRFTVAGRDFALPSAPMRRATARSEALETAREQARMQSEIESERRTRENLGFYKALGVVGEERGNEFDPGIPYEALLDYRRTLAGRGGTGGRSGGGSGGDAFTMDDINAQVAKYVDAIARSGYDALDPEGWPAGKRSYTEQELINKGNEMRRILLQMYGTPVPPVPATNTPRNFNLFEPSPNAPPFMRGERGGQGGEEPGTAGDTLGELGRTLGAPAQAGATEEAPMMSMPPEGTREGFVSPFRNKLRNDVAEWRRLSGSEAPMPRGIDLQRYATTPEYKAYIDGELRRMGYEIGGDR